MTNQTSQRTPSDPRDTREMLDWIQEAALAITSELSLPVVLERIVNIARDLSGANYAALGVPGVDGKMEQFITSGMPRKEVENIPHPPAGIGLLGKLLAEKDQRVLRIANLQEHPDFSGFVKGHPQMTSFLGVPIVLRGEILGRLYLTEKQDANEFDSYDERIIVMLAAHAAVAIENARLYQQVQRLAVLEERERIGMDLHDGIIQSIYAVGLTLEYAVHLLDEQPDEARTRLTRVLDDLNVIIKDIRNYILDLRPQKFADVSLEVALRNLLQEFRANTLAEIKLDFDSHLDSTLGPELSSALFHIAQESLANASKHARASHVALTLKPDGDKVIMTVQDNGQGFDQTKTKVVIGHGLSNIGLRASASGGQVVIQSEPGEGTTVRAYLPLKKM